MFAGPKQHFEGSCVVMLLEKRLWDMRETDPKTVGTCIIFPGYNMFSQLSGWYGWTI